MRGNCEQCRFDCRMQHGIRCWNAEDARERLLARPVGDALEAITKATESGHRKTWVFADDKEQAMKLIEDLRGRGFECKLAEKTKRGGQGEIEVSW